MLFFFTLENKKSETIYNRGLKNGNTLQKMSQPEESCSSRQEYSSSIFRRRLGKIMGVKKKTELSTRDEARKGWSLAARHVGWGERAAGAVGWNRKSPMTQARAQHMHLQLC